MMTIFEALADPTRRQILDLLRERPRLVGELVDRLHLSQPGISKHLRVLREAGLVRVRQDAQRRWYELRQEPLAEIDTWLASYRHLWDAKFDRLDDYLQEWQAMEKNMTTNNSPDMQPGAQELTITRTFDAPRELVFKAWTDPKRLAQW